MFTSTPVPRCAQRTRSSTFGYRAGNHKDSFAGSGFLFDNYTVMAIFFTLTTVGIACEFVCVLVSTYAMILGPEVAIRGAEEEQRRAIAGMYAERRVALMFFWAGGGFQVLAGMTLGWLKYPLVPAWCITAVFLILLVWSFYYLVHDLNPAFSYVDAEGLDCHELVPAWRRSLRAVASSNAGARVGLREPLLGGDASVAV